MKQRVWSLILALAMVLSLFPAPVWAEEEGTAVEYLDSEGKSATQETYTLMTAETTLWNNEWYVVKGSVTIDALVTVQENTPVKLILCDGATLTLTKGLQLWGYTTAAMPFAQLTIYGQNGNSGKLEISNSSGEYAIFSQDTPDAHIRLLGGTLKATGSEAALNGVSGWNGQDSVPNDPVVYKTSEDGPTLTVSKCSKHQYEYTQSETVETHMQKCELCGYIPDWDGNAGAEYVPCTYQYASLSPAEHKGTCACGREKTEAHDMANGVCTKCGYRAATSTTAAAKIGEKEYTSLPAALNAAQDDDTVKLLADHTTNWSDVEASEYATLAVVKKTLTLDLNGKTVDYLVVGDVVPDEAGGIVDSCDGNLTVADSAQGGSHGKIKDLEFVKGSLAIRGGRIGGCLTCDGNSGSVTISGGTVLGLTVGEGAVVNVNGGSAHAGAWLNDGTLNITGGTFDDVRFLNNGGTIAISGGTFGTITNTNASGSIPLMPLLADNYAFYQGDNAQNSTEKTLNNVTVRPHTHSFENGKCGCGVAAIVADNNNSCYNTLQAALDAAANDATITSVTLGQDLTEDVMFNRSAAGALTLNMNGHKLEATAGVPLTVIGGTLCIEGAAEINQNTASNANPFPAISLTGGKLVIAGDLTAQGGYNSSNGRKPAIYATDGELDLQGNVSLNGGLTMLDNAKLTNLLTKGTFYVDASETGNAIAITDSEVYNKALDLLAKDYAFYRADDRLADAGSFILRTGTYTIKPHTCSYTQDEAHGLAYCKCGRSHAHRDLSEEKSVLVNGVCPICGYHCPHNTVDETTLSCSDCGAKVVAKVEVEGSEPTYVFDLASAFQNAVNGTTIKLLANEMLPDGIYVSKTLTLDLNGHSLGGYSLNVGGLTYPNQVRTGNLTVIDSSGGNGAVGVAVREGGTLVFDPKNDHTTLLQLEVWGGTVKLYGGKILRSGLRLNNGITLGNLLPGEAGLAYYRDDTQLTLEEAASKTCDLVVKSCSHGGKNGFDISAAACPYCNAPAVAKTALKKGEYDRLWRNFANLQDALDADRDGGAELTLLADVTGDYTINGTQDTGLDLNGHSIKGTVTVKGIKGDYITTTLSNTQNTTTASIDAVVAFDGAELAGSKYPAVIGELTLAEGATWKNILNEKALGYKVLNADGTHKWYAQDDVKVSQLNNVIINRLPITSNTLNLKVDGKNLTGRSLKAERGTTIQLCASCNAKDANVSIYIGEIDGNNEPKYSLNKAEYKKIGTTWYYVVDLKANTIGTYDIYFTATKDGYSVTSASKKLTVTKPNLSNAEITFPYGNEAAFNYATSTGVPTFVVTYKGQTLDKDKDFTITKGSSTYAVGPCTLTIKATDNGDYTGSKSAEWNVRPLKVEASVGDIIKTYDGTTNLPKDTKITFKSADTYYTGTTLRLAKSTDYEVLNACYDSADASTDEKTVSFTIKLKNEGYVFEDGTTEKAFTLKGSETDKTFKINKAAIASDTQLYQTVFNDLAKTYKIDLKQFLDTILPAGGKYGDIQYGTPGVSMYADYYPAGGATIENGKLRLSINKAASFKQGKEIGTVTVEVETTNYQTFTLTIHVSVQDKIVPVLDGTISASEITYGQTLADSKLTVNGTMQDRTTGDAVDGTFAWTDGTIKPDAGSYDAEWTFTPDSEEYATVTGKTTVKVAPKSIEGAKVTLEADSFVYDGNKKMPVVKSVVLDNVTLTSLTDYGYIVVKMSNVGIYNFTITGDGNYTGEVKATWQITAREVTPAIEVASCSYTGDALEPNVTVKDDLGNTIDPKEYEIFFSNNTNAGTGRVTIKDVAGGNYVIKEKTQDFTITKAAAPTGIQTGTLNVINGTTLEYTYDAKQILPAAPNGTYGTVFYSGEPSSNFESGYTVNSFNVGINSGVLTLTIDAQNGGKTDKIGSVTIYVTTDNYEIFNLPLDLYAVDKITPVVDGDITASNITYSDELSKSEISGKMKDPNTGDPVDGTFAWTDGKINPNAGDYEADWTFTPAAGYEKYATVTGKATVKVNKATPTFTAPTANTLTYTGSEQPLLTAGSTQGGTMKYRLGESGEFVDSIPNGKDAGTYTVYFKVMGDGNHNDTEVQFVSVTIDPLPISLLSVSSISKTYDGSADVTLTADKLTFFSKTASRQDITLPNTALTFSDAQFTSKQEDGSYLPSPEVGGGKALSFTMTLTSSNYVFEGKSGGTTEVSDVFATDDANRFTITKAPAPALTPITRSQKYNQVTERTITLPELTTLGMPGDAKVPDSNAFHGDGCDVEGTAVPTWDCDVNTGAITYTLTGAKAGDKVTFTLKVRSQNYADATLTVILNVTDLDTPVVEAQDITVDYTGQPVPASEIKGTATFDGKTVEGTWSWKEGQKLTNVRDSGEKTVIFTPEDTNHYKTVETTVKLTIKRVPAVWLTLPTAKALTYTGQAQALVTPGTASGGTMKYALDGNWKWSEAIPTATEAGTYQVACGIVGDENHETTPGPSLTVIIVPATLTDVSARQDGTLTYTGQPQSASVTTAATTVDGKPVTFTYSAKEDGDYTDVVPAFTNAGDYPVYYKASAANHAEVTGRFTVTIGRAAAIFTAPAARELTYNGQPQALVSAGSTGDGVMKYSLTQDGPYTETPPTGTGAGSYTVWYQVEGDGNHNGFGPQSVAVTIAPKTVTATVTVLGGPFAYTGSAIEPAVTVRDGETVIDPNEYTVSYDRNTHVGTAAVIVTDKAGGNYTVSGTGAFTIEKAAPAVTAPTGKTLTYDGQAQTLVNAGSTPDGTLQYSLDGTAYSTEIPAAKKAGTYTVWYQVKGDGNHTDTAPQSISVTIERRAISITGCAVADKTYTGETGGTVTAVTFRDLAQGDTLVLGSDFSAKAVFASADAASDIPVTATVQLLGSDLAGNYVLTESSFQTTGSIVPAQAPAAAEGTIQIVNELVHTYTLELSKLLPTLAEPAEFGSLEYGRPDAGLGEGYGTIAIVDKDGVLSLKIAYSNSERTGEVGAITVPVTTRNYGTFDLTVRVIAQNKPIPQGEPALSKNTLVYGEMLNTITLSGEMKVGGITVPGTFSWDEVTEPLQAGEHTLGWTFTPADGDAYRAAHGTADITVSPASLSGTAAVSTLPNGGTLADVTLTPDASWPSGDFVWVDQEGNVLPGDTRVTANASYTWEFRPADSRNYLPVQGTAVLWNYTPITPVGPAKPSEPEGPAKPAFSDVDEDDFFAPAVEWAADNGITGGIGNGLFGPDRVCTRGQIVTFLWRAAGSPESRGVSGFADVAEDAYYAQAVAWAVEKGITGGIGNGLFAPDAVCTRAQIVTFLWRAAGMPAPQSGVNPFTDVPADAWYTQAVLWAVEKGITTGMGGGLFGPDVPCTRAQVVTFLYRANSAK
mgnify:CR=1 FL=1